MIPQAVFYRHAVPLLIFLFFRILSCFSDRFYAVGAGVTLSWMFFCFRGHGKEIPGGKYGWAVLTGLIAGLVWLLPPEITRGSPLTGVRMIGFLGVTPVVEELFFRSFLMRVLIRPDFLSVRLGEYKPFPFWAAVAVFGLMHRPEEWGVALAAGLLYGLYLVRTGSLRGCMLAHAVSNLVIFVS